MTEQFDPIDWLRERDPISGRLDDGLNSAIAETILARALERSSSRRRRSRRLIPGLTVAAVLVASGGAVAAFFVTRSSSPNPATVVCFAEVDLGASRAVVERGEDPVEACSAAWHDPDLSEVFGGREIPQLRLCRLESGVEAAFPAERADTCKFLGIEPAQGPQSADENKLRALTGRLAKLMDGGCVSVDQAASLAEQTIDAVGLDGWTVEVPPGPADGACGTISVDADTSVISIIPLPPEAVVPPA